MTLRLRDLAGYCCRQARNQVALGKQRIYRQTILNMTSNTSFLENLINNGIEGKIKALHAYDRLMWTVRSGYLTLVFAGWGFLIKSAVDAKLSFPEFAPYAQLLSVFTIALSLAAFRIDISYVQKKFRVIQSLHRIMDKLATVDFERPDNQLREMIEYLKIAGEADNKNYDNKSYRREQKLIMLIYLLPGFLSLCILLFSLWKKG